MLSNNIKSSKTKIIKERAKQIAKKSRIDFENFVKKEIPNTKLNNTKNGFNVNERWIAHELAKQEEERAQVEDKEAMKVTKHNDIRNALTEIKKYLDALSALNNANDLANDESAFMRAFEDIKKHYEKIRIILQPSFRDQIQSKPLQTMYDKMIMPMANFMSQAGNLLKVFDSSKKVEVMQLFERPYTYDPNNQTNDLQFPIVYQNANFLQNMNRIDDMLGALKFNSGQNDMTYLMKWKNEDEENKKKVPDHDPLIKNKNLLKNINTEEKITANGGRCSLRKPRPPRTKRCRHAKPNKHKHSHKNISR